MSEETSTVTESVATGLTPVRLQTPLVSLKRLIVATIRADADCKALLGIRANVDDPRVYAYYSPSAIVDEDHPAYVTYAHTSSSERFDATGKPIFNLAIWALDWVTAEAVRDRLLALFDNKNLTTITGRTVHADALLMHDNYQENTKFASIVVQVRFGFSQV